MRARSQPLFVVVLAACAAASALPGTGLGASAPQCPSSQLTLTFIGFQGATGHRYGQKNMGPPYLCPGSEGVFPVTAQPGP